MTKYKGNSGNLMQHWTLCELLHIADEQNVPGLNFIDAHAMAPWATDCLKPTCTFERVRKGLPGQHSVYEQSWHQLARNGGYPNSANFVQHIWTRDFSMLLCEKNAETVDALDAWLPKIQRHLKCQRAKVFHGDWRTRFGKGLPSPKEVGLPDGSLTLVSFDPNMYSLSKKQANPEKLYPKDIEQTLLPALEDVHGPVIIQLSTYAIARIQSAQCKVIESVDQILKQGSFTQAVVVRLNGNMMSLVYSRNVPWANKLADLPNRFKAWLP